MAARLLCGGSLALIIAGTLIPAGSQTFGFARCVFCNPRALADGIVNLALFVPLALSIRLMGVGSVATTAIGAALSAAIEIAQLSVPGRDPSLSDLIANTAGALAGALAGGSIQQLTRPATAVSERLALMAATAAAVTIGLTGYLTAPSLPATVYYGQWTPTLQSLEPYLGTLVNATIGGVVVPSDRLHDSEQVRRRLLAGEPVQLDVRAGPPTSRISAIFGIADEDTRRVLLIGAVRNDLVFRYRTRALDWALDQPDVRSGEALASIKKDDVLNVVVAPQPSGFCATVNDRQRCGIGYGAGDGWSLLVSSASIPLGTRTILQACWIGLIVLPVGFWSRRGWRSLAAAAFVLTALILGPSLTGLLPSRATEWAGAAGGFAFGVAVRSRWF